MRKRDHCISVESLLANKMGEMVPIFVNHNHPLLRLKAQLPWDQIREIMVKRWEEAGKNLDGRPGSPWPVWLYVPLLTLMIIKRMDPRKMEEYLSENAVGRVFVSQQNQLEPQIRDHSSIDRAMATLGQQTVEQINQIILKVALKLGFTNLLSLSADTTVQELAIGYPNEPGILRGIAQRCQRALQRLIKKGEADTAIGQAIEKCKTVFKSVKEHHLFAKTKEEKTRILERLIEETRELFKETTPIIEKLKDTLDKVKKGAREKLQSMKEVTDQLIPQIQQWMKTGKVAKDKILHPVITAARAIVKNKIGKKVDFGLKYLVNRLKGGYLFIKEVTKIKSEYKMPPLALEAYQEIFGKEHTPQRLTYDRGGCSQKTIRQLQKAGVAQIAIQPKGKKQWLIAEDLQKVAMQERGMTEGSIGTIKSDKYKFNNSKERSHPTITASAQMSVLSSNLNKLMRDIVKHLPALKPI